MKPTNVPATKDLKTGKLLQRRQGNFDSKFRLKDQIAKRQRIYNVNAGHVRGGHSFH